MRAMFFSASSFNQDLSGWCVESLAEAGLFDGPQVNESGFMAFSIASTSNEATTLLTLNNGPEQATTKPAPLSAETLRFGFVNDNPSRPEVFRNIELGSGDQLTVSLDFAATESRSLYPEFESG